MIKKIRSIFSVFIISLFVSGSIAQGSLSGGLPYEEGVVLVGFNNNVSSSEAKTLINEQNFKLREVVGLGVHVIEVPDTIKAISMFRQLPEVRYAEPNGIVESTVVPNDPLYSQLYGMEKISAPLAWNQTTGSPNVVVGITDTG